MLADAARMKLVVFLFLTQLICGPAMSGAWLREQGTAFAAASVTVFSDEMGGYEYKTGLYAEWGFRPRLTLGLDAEEHRDLYGHALVFARVPVADFGNPGRLAAEFGLGAYHNGIRAWALYKATLSYGKGIETGLGNGWLAVDAALEYRSHDALIRKLDFTIGLNSGRRLDPLMQVETSYTPGRSVYWTARPSLIYRPKSGKITWIFGAERNSVRADTGVKFALWTTY